MGVPTLKAVEVENLDKAGEDAFLRLSAGLPSLASELAAVAKAAGELGEDLIAVPAVPRSTITFEKALADLELLEKMLANSPEASRARKLRARMIGLGGMEKGIRPRTSPKDLEAIAAREAAGKAADAVYCSRCKDEIPCCHFSADGEFTETGRRLNERIKARKDFADAPQTGGDVSTPGLAANGGVLVPAQGRPKKPKKDERIPGEQPGVLPQYRELNLGTEVALSLRDDTQKGSGTSLGLALASTSGPPPAETPEPKKKPDGKHLFPADVGAPAVESGGATSGEGGGGGMVASGVSMRDEHFTDSWDRKFIELLTGDELEKRVRSEMPQIPTEKLQEFVTFLRDRGIAVEPTTVAASALTGSQDDLNKAKVDRIKQQGLAKLLEGPELLVASGKGSESAILDGHHRAAAIRELDPTAKVRCFSIQAPIEDAIAAAHEFPHAQVRGINDGVIKVRFVAKRAKAADLESDGEEEQRTVLGIVLEPETVDSQGDIYDEDTIRETAWRFAERYQHFGLMHRQIIPGVVLLETYLAPVDFQIEDRTGTMQPVKKGTWLLRVRVTDDAIWQAVKDGRLDGFSIGGSAIRQKIRGGKKTAA